MIIEPTVKQIFDQLNRMLAERVAQGNIIEHNLEKGLGAEKALREVLADFLPVRFGIAKGKVINSRGKLSRHCDVLIYDQVNYPRLFIDENENQMLPIEGVYAVLEVKTTLTKHTLTEAFANLNAIYDLQPERPVRSLNHLMDYRPPYLAIVGFRGIKLSTLERHFRALSLRYKVRSSFSSYSNKSPGYANFTGDTFLAHSVACFDSGSVFHAFNGEVKSAQWGEYTLGVFLTTLLNSMEQVSLAKLNIFDYFNSQMVDDPSFFKYEHVFVGSSDICEYCGMPHSSYVSMQQTSGWRTARPRSSGQTAT
jgi:hypothetical protein